MHSSRTSDDDPEGETPQRSDIPWDLDEKSVDSFSSYEELQLEDGRSLRKYDSGNIRLENPRSGVIHEERPDGSLLISLPTGRVVYQEYRGEPLLVYNTNRGGGTGTARVGAIRLPGSLQTSYAVYFTDHEGQHLVELQTLRYYRIKQKAG